MSINKIMLQNKFDRLRMQFSTVCQFLKHSSVDIQRYKRLLIFNVVKSSATSLSFMVAAVYIYSTYLHALTVNSTCNVKHF